MTEVIMWVDCGGLKPLGDVIHVTWSVLGSSTSSDGMICCWIRLHREGVLVAQGCLSIIDKVGGDLYHVEFYRERITIRDFSWSCRFPSGLCCVGSAFWRLWKCSLLG